jgi:hypothetical protein
VYRQVIRTKQIKHLEEIMAIRDEPSSGPYELEAAYTFEFRDGYTKLNRETSMNYSEMNRYASASLVAKTDQESASASLVAKADREPSSASLVAKVDREPSHNVVSSSNSYMDLSYVPNKICDDSKLELRMVAKESSLFIKEKLLLEQKLKFLQNELHLTQATK